MLTSVVNPKTLYFVLITLFELQNLDVQVKMSTVQVPEVSNTTEPSLNMDMLVSKIEMAQATVGVNKAVPMLVGPITMARIASLSAIDVPMFVQKLVPVYTDLLGKLAAMKVCSSVCGCVMLSSCSYVASLRSALLVTGLHTRSCISCKC